MNISSHQFYPVERREGGRMEGGRMMRKRVGGGEGVINCTRTKKAIVVGRQ